MLAWLDIETTGLNPDIHPILEIAIVVTDDDLCEVGHSSTVIKRSILLDLLHKDVLEMHMANGLLLESTQALYGLTQVEIDFRCWLDADFPNVDFSKVPLAGSSVHFDRAFLKRQMPMLESKFHYRSVDVSTIKELLKRWRPDWAIESTDKEHRALTDARASIEELQRYRELLRLTPVAPWEE